MFTFSTSLSSDLAIPGAELLHGNNQLKLWPPWRPYGHSASARCVSETAGQPLFLLAESVLFSLMKILFCVLISMRWELLKSQGVVPRKIPACFMQ